MRTYTEEELKLAIDYACSYQKADSYGFVGSFLIEDFKSVQEADKAIVQTLDYLCDCDNNAANQITIEEVTEYIDSKK